MSDVQLVFEAAAAATSPVRYRLPTYATAVNFRQRAYKYRKLLLHRSESIMGKLASTPYDDFIISLETPTGAPVNRKPENPGLPVDVVFYRNKIAGTLLSSAGEVIEISPTIPSLELE